MLKEKYLNYLKEPIVDYNDRVRKRFYGVDTFEKFEESINSKLDDFEGNIYFISDHHFNHKNIIRFSDRPFVDLHSMETFLIDQHNDIVKDDDIVIFVGDFGFCGNTVGKELLSRMNGYKIIVLGNHDVYHGKIKNFGYDELYVLKELVYNNQKLVITHFPFLGVEDTHLNIHGHVHKGGHYDTEYTNHFNVNCEFINYSPIHIDKIL